MGRGGPARSRGGPVRPGSARALGAARAVVDYYWIVRWDLRGQPPHEQTILPHPHVHLVFEASGAGIYGVDRDALISQLSALKCARTASRARSI